MNWRELSREHFRALQKDMLTHGDGWIWDNMEVHAALRWEDFKSKWFPVLVTGCHLSLYGQLSVKADLQLKVDCTLVRAKFIILWRGGEIILEDQTLTIELTPKEEHVLRLEKRLWA